jgi:peroxiredoxin
MISKKILTILFVLTALAIAGWYYKAFKTVPALPAYENDLINEQGQAIKINNFKGKYVLISYFQTWCGTCIKELPSIDALQMKLGKDKLQILMVSDESIEKIGRFKEKHCNTLDYYQSQKPLNEISIRIFPTTYLLNKEGIVIMSKLDQFDWGSDEVINKCK